MPDSRDSDHHFLERVWLDLLIHVRRNESELLRLLGMVVLAAVSLLAGLVVDVVSTTSDSNGWQATVKQNLDRIEDILPFYVWLMTVAGITLFLVLAQLLLKKLQSRRYLRREAEALRTEVRLAYRSNLEESSLSPRRRSS